MSLLIAIKSALVFFGFFVLAHVILCRLTGSGYFMLKSILLGSATTLLLLGYQIHNNQINLVGLYIFTSGWLLYLMFFINLLNSVTLKMLDYLYSSPNGELHQYEFEATFNNQNGLERRIDLMIKNRFFLIQGDKLYLTKKALIFLGAISNISWRLSIPLD
jgi:hypothetical protein